MDSPNSDSKKANVQFYRTGLDFELGKCKNIVSTKSNDPNVPDDKRIEIAASSGMKYTIYGGRNKQSFVVAYGKISGSVLVIMPGGAKSYMVVYTKDLIDYKDRSDPVSSTASRVVIENLEKDKKYAFFYKPIIPGEKSDWIGPITKTVV